MTWFLGILFGAIAVFAVIYFFFPALLVGAVIGSMRKWGRMRVRSVVVNGIEWPYLEGGPADAETIVMVHGFGGDKDNWPLYARYFTRRFRVIAPDLPGFGENVRKPDWEYGMEAQAGRLNEFLNELGIDKCHLTGNSMGGFIALHYALAYPQRLQSLTLVDNAGVTSRNKSELEIAIDEKKNLLVANSLEEFESLLDFIMYKRIPSPAFMVKAMFEVQARNAEFLDRIFWTLADEAVNGTVTDRLGEISVPTLVIWGRHDRVIDVSCTEAMAAAIPDNKVVIFEDAGHVPMIEKPHETADQQIGLISELGTDPAGG
jgi:abhydrolase domain-containing protein 6